MTNLQNHQNTQNNHGDQNDFSSVSQKIGKTTGNSQNKKSPGVEKTLTESTPGKVVSLKGVATPKELALQEKIKQLKQNAIILADKVGANDKAEKESMSSPSVTVDGLDPKTQLDRSVDSFSQDMTTNHPVAMSVKAKKREVPRKTINTDKQRTAEQTIDTVDSLAGRSRGRNNLVVEAIPAWAGLDSIKNKQKTNKILEKYADLPVIHKLGLGSREIAEKIIEIAQRYNLVQKEKIVELAQLVREIYTDLLSENKILARLKRKLKLSSDQTDQFLEDLKEIALLVKKIGYHKARNLFKWLPIKKIMEKNPQELERRLTKGMLVTKEGEEVIPTVGAWLDDYLKTMGSEKHTGFERSKYLSTSVNVANLTAADRARVENLLRSYDEDIPLAIDPESEAVLYDILWEDNVTAQEKERLIDNLRIEDSQQIDIDDFLGNQPFQAFNSLKQSKKQSITTDQDKNNVLDLSGQFSGEEEVKK